MHGHYILKDKKAVPVDDLIEWTTQLENQDRKVAKDTIEDVEISTVFLGLDHQFGKGESLLFETMIFGGELDQEQERYSTWEEAEIGHRQIVEKVKQTYYPFYRLLKRKRTTKQLEKIIKLMRKS